MQICHVIDADDLEKCFYVRRKVFIEEKGIDEKIEIDELDKNFDCCMHFLILDGEEPVGTFRTVEVDDKTVKLQRFCLLNQRRKKGYGKSALNFAEEYFKNLGMVKIVADAKFEAVGFYEKCGYKIVSDVFEEAGIPHVKIEKIL